MGDVLHVTTSGGNDAFGTIATAQQDVWVGYDIYIIDGIGTSGALSGTFDFIGDTGTFGGSGVAVYYDTGTTYFWPWYASNLAGFGSVAEGVWYHIDHRFSPGSPNVTEEIWIDGVDQGEIPSGAVTDPVVGVSFGTFSSNTTWPLDFYLKNMTAGTTKGGTDIWDGDLSSGDINTSFDTVSVSAPAAMEIVQASPAPGASVIVTLDGLDVTNCCVAGNWTRRLNRPSTAQIRVPMDCASADVGTLLKIEALIGTSYEIVHHGRILLVETDTGEDTGYTVYNSTDPMELWQWRPVRDDTCDFSVPTIIDDYVTGPQIIEAALENTVYCGGSSPASTEGPIFLDMGVFDTGGVDLTGAPTDWPMTIAELASLLISTGELDLVITPTDPGGGIMGTIDGYNGDYGTDLSASVIFSYGMGDYNVRRLRWNQDMTTMTNKLWYYAGPRRFPPSDPAGDQHWNFNITGDDPAFNPDGTATGVWTLATSYVDEDPGPADVVTNGGFSYICIADNAGTANSEPGVGALWQQFWTVLMVPPGGRSSPTASATDNQLGVLRIDSQTDYGVRMDIQIFDAYDNNAGNAPNRDLFRKRWQQEAWLRAQPREIIHITPTRETEIGTFDIGDLVGVEAVSAVRGGFTGAQRVYEYTVSWDNDGVLELSELQTSADNEGL